MPPKQQKLSLKNRALGYLALREYSRLELGRKLARYAEPDDDIEAVLDFMEKARFLSTERFSEALIRRRASSFGNSRIMAELRTHQLDPELLARSKAELTESEQARARAVWEKKFGSAGGAGSAVESGAPTDPAQRAKQIRFLAQRGFSPEAIRAAMRGAPMDEAETYDEQE